MEQITPMNDEQVAVVMKTAADRLVAAGVPEDQVEQFLTQVLTKAAEELGMVQEPQPSEEEALFVQNYLTVKDATAARLQQHLPGAPAEEIQKMAHAIVTNQLDAEAAEATKEASEPQAAVSTADRFRALLNS